MPRGPSKHYACCTAKSVLETPVGTVSDKRRHDRSRSEIAPHVPSNQAQWVQYRKWESELVPRVKSVMGSPMSAADYNQRSPDSCCCEDEAPQSSLRLALFRR